MRQKNIIALFVSDLHLSHTAPSFRSMEKNWYAAMQRPVDELKRLQQIYKCPIFCAGDIFDRWNSPAELINWSLEHLPEMYAIPGQHDLPDHNINEIKRSAYWTLVKAKKIHNLSSDFSKAFFLAPDTTVTGFAFGEQIKSGQSSKKHKHIAIIHQYNWVNNKGYKNADPKQYLSLTRTEFEGYDLIVSGDNHQPWYHTIPFHFVNSGTFIRRHINEKEYPVRITMLTDDGSIYFHVLDTSKDKYLEDGNKKESTEDIDLKKLMKELEKLGDAKMDFRHAIQCYLEQNNSTQHIRKILNLAMNV